MIRRNRNIARIISIILSTAVALTTLPVSSMPVYATEESCETESFVNEEAYDAESIANEESDDAESFANEKADDAEKSADIETCEENAEVTDIELTQTMDAAGVVVDSMRLSMADTLTKDETREINNISKTSTFWLKYTAVTEGYYFVDSVGADVDESELMVCRYYIGSMSDASRADQLDCYGNAFGKDSDKRMDPKRVRIGCYLEEGETIYVYFEAKDDIDSLKLKFSTPEELNGDDSASVVCNPGEVKSFIINAKGPRTALRIGFEGANNVTYEAFKNKDLRAAIDYSRDAAEKNDYVLNDVKEGDSYIIRMANKADESATYTLNATYLAEEVLTVGEASGKKKIAQGKSLTFEVNVKEEGYYFISNTYKGEYIPANAQTGTVSKEYAYVGLELSSTLKNDGTFGDECYYFGEDPAGHYNDALYDRNVSHLNNYFSYEKVLQETRVFYAKEKGRLSPGTYYIKVTNNDKEDWDDFVILFDKVIEAKDDKAFSADVSVKLNKPVVYDIPCDSQYTYNFKFTSNDSDVQIKEAKERENEEGKKLVTSTMMLLKDTSKYKDGGAFERLYYMRQLGTVQEIDKSERIETKRACDHVIWVVYSNSASECQVKLESSREEGSSLIGKVTEEVPVEENEIHGASHNDSDVATTDIGEIQYVHKTLAGKVIKKIYMSRFLPYEDVCTIRIAPDNNEKALYFEASYKTEFDYYNGKVIKVFLEKLGYNEIKETEIIPCTTCKAEDWLSYDEYSRLYYGKINGLTENTDYRLTADLYEDGQYKGVIISEGDNIIINIGNSRENPKSDKRTIKSVASVTGFSKGTDGKAGIQQAKVTAEFEYPEGETATNDTIDLKLFYRKKGSKLAWSCVEKKDCVLNDGVFSEGIFTGALEENTTYDYVLMINDEVREKYTDLKRNIEYITEEFEADKGVMIIGDDEGETGFKTQETDFSLDGSITIPSKIDCTYDKENNINEIPVKLKGPASFDKIKVCVTVDEAVDGVFRSKLGKNTLKKSNYTTLTGVDGTFIGSVKFDLDEENKLTQNAKYYVKNIQVYVDSIGEEGDFGALLGKAGAEGTIVYTAPGNTLWFEAGSDVASAFDIAGLEDLTTVEDGDTDRDFDGIKDTAIGTDGYIIAYGTYGDKYQLVFSDTNLGTNILDTALNFKFTLSADDEKKISISSAGLITLKRSGRVSIVIEPKTDSVYRNCAAKTLELNIMRAPEKPDTDVYVVKNVKNSRKLSDISLSDYGFGTDWRWSAPETVVKGKSGDIVSAKIELTDAGKSKYYPGPAVDQDIVFCEFEGFELEFVNDYISEKKYSPITKENKVYSDAMIRDDDKRCATIVVTDEETPKKAIVSYQANFTNCNDDRTPELEFEFENIPDDVTYTDGYAKSYSHINVTAEHTAGLSFKVKNIFIVHRNGDDIVRDVDLLSSGAISEEDIEKNILTLYAVKSSVVDTIQLKVSKTYGTTSKCLNGQTITFNSSDFEGASYELLPEFVDKDGNVIPENLVNYSVESSNPSIVSIEEKNALGHEAITISKNIGSAEIVVSVNDGMVERRAAFRILVTNLAPKVNTKSATVNNAYDYTSEAGWQLVMATETPVEIVPVDGTKIKNIVVAETCKKDSKGIVSEYAEAECLKLVKADLSSGSKNNKYYLKTDNSIVKTKNYFIVAEVSTEENDLLGEKVIRYGYPLRVVARNTTVKATAKNLDTYNLFFKRGDVGRISVTLKGNVFLDTSSGAEESIFGGTDLEGNPRNKFAWEDNDLTSNTNGFTLSLADENAKSAKHPYGYAVDKLGNYTYTFILDADNLEMNGKKLANPKVASGVLTLNFKGYLNPVTLKLKLPVVYSKPTLKAYVDKNLIPKAGIMSGKYVLLDNNKTYYKFTDAVSESGDYAAFDYIESSNASVVINPNEDEKDKENIGKVKLDAKGNIEWGEETVPYEFQYTGSKKNDSTKLTLNSDDWRESLNVTLKLSSVEPSVKFVKGADSVTFNTAFASSFRSELSTNVSMENGSIAVTAANETGKRLLDSNLLEFKLAYENGSAYIVSTIAELNSVEPKVKAGNYSFNISPTYNVNGKTETLKPLKFTVKITDKKPTITYTLKGAVNNLAVLDNATLEALLKNCRNTTEMIKVLSMYSLVVTPKLTNFPSGSTVQHININGDDSELLFEIVDLYEGIEDSDVSIPKAPLTFIARDPFEVLDAGSAYTLYGKTTVLIGDDSGENRPVFEETEADIHAIKFKIVQSTPKVTITKATDRQTLFMSNASQKCYIDFVVPLGYKMTGAEGSLDLNRDNIPDVRVKSETVIDESSGESKILYYGYINQNPKFIHTKGTKSINVPVTVYLNGQDGKSKGVQVKVGFVLAE